MTQVVLLLGGNVGDVESTFDGVRKALSARVGEIIDFSDVLRSEAWGFDSDEFLNQAVLLSTEIEAEELLDELQAIESEWGRERLLEAQQKEESGQRYLSRAIDIDIIFYGDSVIETERLTVPHLLIAKREFALEPIAQIAPHLVHPKTGKSVEQMLNELKC